MENETAPISPTGCSGCVTGPGSARHGNFINYYSFNPARARIDLIPRSTVVEIISSLNEDQTTMTALDIGCNAGELTCSLFNHFKNDSYELKILGVDLDETLIERSCENNSYTSNVTFKVADIIKREDQEKVILQYLQSLGAVQFDVLFCFSVTMWIHLNHGDEKLKQFLRFISSIAKWIIIEPQPWKCYKTAVRRAKRLGSAPFENYQHLKWRENVDLEIREYLTKDCKCNLFENLGKTNWDRQLCVFKCQ